ncbi:MAG: F0F1 ATP synthase subunit alpha, partial [Candidatus Omnitrophica bacterium]|nr:F0F1 ATP synthase subunit alpha [Candidatus Omnitrophota bacterium]
RELAAFAKFGSDLDAATQRQLNRGARQLEVLKQGQYKPLPVEQQVIQLIAATAGIWDDVPEKEVARFSDELLETFKVSQQDILKEIAEKKEISDELREKILSAITTFKESALAAMA